MNNSDQPVNVPTGRLLFIDPHTLVYVPWRATVAEARNTMLHIYHEGISRPVPGKPQERERVYPRMFIPTDDPNTYDLEFADDGGELHWGKLIVRFPGQRNTTNPPGNYPEEERVDPFTN